MRNLIIICVLLITILACKKDCISDIEDTDVFLKNYFNNYNCSGLQPWSTIYYSYDEFLNDNNCYWTNPIVVPLDFNGLIITQGVYTDFYKNEHQVKIFKDECEKIITYTFFITQIDTLSVSNNVESVITVINSIPSDYTVEFSHEIIPYTE